MTSQPRPPVQPRPGHVLDGPSSYLAPSSQGRPKVAPTNPKSTSPPRPTSSIGTRWRGSDDENQINQPRPRPNNKELTQSPGPRPCRSMPNGFRTRLTAHSSSTLGFSPHKSTPRSSSTCVGGLGGAAVGSVDDVE